MKSTLILLLSLTNITFTLLSAQGIGFQSDTLRFQAVLDKAKAENKLVFIDAYTSWCGPCKRMAKDIFPQKAVGEVYNAAFVNVKMDMEKGEGPGLAQKYGVRSYPTLLYIGADGKVVHNASGARPSESRGSLGTSDADFAVFSPQSADSPHESPAGARRRSGFAR